MTTETLTRPGPDYTLTQDHDQKLAWDERVDEFAAELTAELEAESSDFDDLVQEWRDDTLFSSSPVEITTHDAYLRILSKGPAVLPQIFREMVEHPGELWFVALQALTAGADPAEHVPDGDVAGMTRAWLDWARDEAYIA
jgi:hypothetical protein